MYFMEVLISKYFPNPLTGFFTFQIQTSISQEQIYLQMQLKKLLVLLGVIVLAAATLNEGQPAGSDEGFEGQFQQGEGDLQQDEEPFNQQDQDQDQNVEYLDQSDFEGVDQAEEYHTSKKGGVFNSDGNFKENIFGSYTVDRCKNKRPRKKWNVDFDDFNVFLPDADDASASYQVNPKRKSWKVGQFDWNSKNWDRELGLITQGLQNSNRYFRKGDKVQFRGPNGNPWLRLKRNGLNKVEGRRKPRRSNRNRNDWDQYNFFDQFDQDNLRREFNNDVSTGQANPVVVV